MVPCNYEMETNLVTYVTKLVEQIKLYLSLTVIELLEEGRIDVEVSQRW